MAYSVPKKGPGLWHLSSEVKKITVCGFCRAYSIHEARFQATERSPLHQISPIRRRSPKDSAIQNILCYSKFTTRSKFTIAQWFAIATLFVRKSFSLGPMVLHAFLLTKKGSHGSKYRGRSLKNTLGQKSCRTKFPRIFWIFVPNFARILLRIFLEFSRIFRASIRGKPRPEKITENPRHFSMQNSQPNTKKIFTKCFWRAGKVTIRRSDSLSRGVFSTAGSFEVGRPKWTSLSQMLWPHRLATE